MFIACWIPWYQTSDDAGVTQESKPEQVAAVVDGHPISLARVDRHLRKTLGDKKLAESVLVRARQEALDYLIDRHVVLNAVQKSGSKYGDSEVKFELSHFKDRLREVGKTLEQHLQQSNTTQTELEYELGWRIAWKKYLARHLTPEKLGQYYQKHRRKFDGTKMRVAHLLLDGDQDRDKAKQLATEIRNSVINKQTSWSDAVTKHSIATSSATIGGEVGWITYDGPMSPRFCEAAMKLNTGDISSPVTTPFGVHLIKCLEIQSGKVRQEELQQRVKEDATEFLFSSLSSKNRSATNIKYDSIQPIKTK